MKPLAMGGVVDSNLNVYGIQGLKIADLSIAPSNVNSVHLLVFLIHSFAHQNI